MRIEFFSSIAGVAETFPILNAKECIPDWITTARADYLKSDKKDIHIFKCPGIIDILTTGFVVTAWHDVEITPRQDAINVTIPDGKLNDLLGKEAVQIQSPNSIAKHIPKRPWSQKGIVKINTPWHVWSKCKLLMIPLPYTEHFEFESTSGILDPGIANEINIQGYWNTQTATIKAGTPLCQIIPLTEKQYSMVCRDANARDNLWLQKRKFFNNFAFVLQRQVLKKVYDKHL